MWAAAATAFKKERVDGHHQCRSPGIQCGHCPYGAADPSVLLSPCLDLLNALIIKFVVMKGFPKQPSYLPTDSMPKGSPVQLGIQSSEETGEKWLRFWDCHTFLHTIKLGPARALRTGTTRSHSVLSCYIIRYKQSMETNGTSEAVQPRSNKEDIGSKQLVITTSFKFS